MTGVPSHSGTYSSLSYWFLTTVHDLFSVMGSCSEVVTKGTVNKEINVEII
jgi:hypothetical protein